MRWLRRFFYSGDPNVKVAAGMSEPEAKMLRELLQNNGIPAMIRNMTILSETYGSALGNDYDMWVKQSDLERAREILAPLLRPDQLVEQHEGRSR